MPLVLFSHPVSEKVIFYVVAHNLCQTALQVCAQDILWLDRGREFRPDSARRPTMVGLSLTLPLSVAQRNLQHRVCESQQLSHRCSVRPFV